MKDLENWTEVTEGIWRYNLDERFWYEIHIEQQNINTDISEAIGSLYMVGGKQSKKSFFYRTYIIRHTTVTECLDCAEKNGCLWSITARGGTTK